MSPDFIGQVVEAIGAGARRLVIWGVAPLTHEMVRDLRAAGLTSYLHGIVDPRPQFEGLRFGPWRVADPASLLLKDSDIVAVASDEDKEQALRLLAQYTRHLPRVLLFGHGHLAFRDPTYLSLTATQFVRSHAGGYPDMLVHLYQSLCYVVSSGLQGAVAEFGVYKGGTTIFIARVLRHLGATSPVFAFDTFAGYPPRRSVLDCYGAPDDEWHDFEAVRRLCEGERITLVRGDIQETHGVLAGVPLILSFFDTDNYSATSSVLGLCYEQTVVGGVLAFDHYHCEARWTYSIGERMAVNEFLPGRRLFNLHGTGIFLKY